MDVEVDGILVVAHELKAPFAVLRQLALALPGMDFEGEHVRNEMVNVSERAIRQVNDLAKIRRLEDGLFEMEPVAVRAVCDDVTKELQYLFRDNKREIKVKYSNRSRLVTANRNLLYSVVYNFLINAMHYSGIGTKAELFVSDSHGRVRIMVRDYGPAGGIEMFSLIDFNLHFGRGEMGIVTGAKMISYYGEILKDFQKMELAGMVLKRTSRVAESSDNPEYFKIVKQCLECLNVNVDIALIESWFLLNLYLAGGEEVNLYRDVKGEKLSAEVRYNWDMTNETFSEKENGDYGSDEIKLLRLMCTTDLKMMRRVKVHNAMYEKILDLVRAAVHI